MEYSFNTKCNDSGSTFSWKAYTFHLHTFWYFFFNDIPFWSNFWIKLIYGRNTLEKLLHSSPKVGLKMPSNGLWKVLFSIHFYQNVAVYIGIRWMKFFPVTLIYDYACFVLLYLLNATKTIKKNIVFCAHRFEE